MSKRTYPDWVTPEVLCAIEQGLGPSSFWRSSKAIEQDAAGVLLSLIGAGFGVYPQAQARLWETPIRQIAAELYEAQRQRDEALEQVRRLQQFLEERRAPAVSSSEREIDWR